MESGPREGTPPLQRGSAVRILEKPGSLEWDYDAEADVRYLSLGAPRAAEGVDVGEGVVLRYDPEQREVVGLTVVGLRARLLKGPASMPNLWRSTTGHASRNPASRESSCLQTANCDLQVLARRARCTYLTRGLIRVELHRGQANHQPRSPRRSAAGLTAMEIERDTERSMT
jgi:uncharacterized protein YuzE